jgi:hypothetical protein
VDARRAADAAVGLAAHRTRATRANDAFSFIGTDAFSAHAGLGHLRYFQIDDPNPSLDRTFVEGDTDGDEIADFQLELGGLHSLTAGGAGADLVL